VVRVIERTPRVIDVKVIVSKGSRSVTKTLSLPAEDMIAVGDILIVDSRRVKVTSISQGEQRVDTAQVSDLSTVWGVDYESVPVHISINKGSGTTISETVYVPPEEEFEVDAIEEIKGKKVLIYAIRTGGGTMKSGSYPAEEIVRIYAKCIREKWGR
jgi:uncharacterized Zn finger protein